jgi:DNA-directed RNA polymerase specialized sigma24 family protein
VFRACRLYLQNAQEAEEACQDALLRVFHGLPKFERQAAFRKWLFRIVANVCATRWAKLSKRADLAARYREIAEFEILGVFVFWLFMLMFLISAAEALGLENVSRTIDSFVTYLPNVIAAAVIVVADLLVCGASFTW